MRCWKKTLGRARVSILVLSVLVAMLSRTAFAAEEQYTYTVRLYAGNQGVLTGEGIEAPVGADVTFDGDRIIISGLKYGDIVYIVYQDAVTVTDERYYARGVRRSGRDNSEATESSFAVASDRDYVIAYGVKGDMVAYTVNYVDVNGRGLLSSDTYYGAVGERQYVSARYVDGYQPQALNMVKTLSANEVENVFDFQYTPVQTGSAPGGTTGGDANGGGVTGGVADRDGVGGGTSGGAGNGGAADGTGVGGDGAADGAGAGAAPEGPIGEGQGIPLPDMAEGGPDVIGGDLTAVPDEEVPQNLQDLDDEDVPLENKRLQESSGRMMGYMPFYIMIGVIAVAALIVMAVLLRKKKGVLVTQTKQRTKKTTDESDDEKEL